MGVRDFGIETWLETVGNPSGARLLGTKARTMYINSLPAVKCITCSQAVDGV